MIRVLLNPPPKYFNVLDVMKIKYKLRGSNMSVENTKRNVIILFYMCPLLLQV